MLKITNEEHNLFLELKKLYEDAELITASYNNEFLNKYSTFNDDELGVDNFLKLLKNEYEIEEMKYTEATLPIFSRFEFNNSEFVLKKFDKYCVIMWNDRDSVDCTLCSTDDVITMINNNYIKLLKY